MPDGQNKFQNGNLKRKEQQEDQDTALSNGTEETIDAQRRGDNCRKSMMYGW